MSEEVIRFGPEHPSLRKLGEVFWEPGQTKMVEFWPDMLVPVTVLYSDSPTLGESLQALRDGKPISIDLEWTNKSAASGRFVEIFQLASSRGVSVIANVDNKGLDELKAFLTSTPLIGKGNHEDRKRLLHCLSVSIQIEDIEVTRLKPNGLSINFERMVTDHLGDGCAKFKDRKMTLSDWSRRPLTVQQVLYAAYDAYAVHRVYGKLFEKYGPLKPPAPQPQGKKGKDKKKGTGQKKPPAERIKVGVMSVAEALAREETQELVTNQPKTAQEELFAFVRKNGGVVETCWRERYQDLLQTKLLDESEMVNAAVAVDFLLRGLGDRDFSGRFTCNVCTKKTFHAFREFCCHVESVHKPTDVPLVPLDIKDVLFKFMIAMGFVNAPYTLTYNDIEFRAIEVDPDDEEEEGREISPIVFVEANGIGCRLCPSERFENVETLRDHCWENHWDKFFHVNAVGKVKVLNGYRTCLFSLFCVNKLGLGRKVNGGIECVKCGEVIPVDFYKHIMQEHRRYGIISDEEYKQWPLKGQDVVLRASRLDLDLQSLHEHGMISEDENFCMICKKPILCDERLKHFLGRHGALVP